MKTDFGRSKRVLLDVRINDEPVENHAATALRTIDERDRLVVACANPHSLVVADSDSAFKAVLNNASAVLADGVGVTLMARLVRMPIQHRVTGHDYFSAVLDALERRGHGRMFFLGSTESVLGLITDKIQKEYPKLTVAGTLSPPFRKWDAAENNKMLKVINSSQPEVLWVGMTAPKQERWVEENRSQLDIPVIASIGAVFDFFAGTHPRAPQWMCRLGVEWLHRLLREPRRMWRRNFISTPMFVALVVRRHLLKTR